MGGITISSKAFSSAFRFMATEANKFQPHEDMVKLTTIKLEVLITTSNSSVKTFCARQ